MADDYTPSVDEARMWYELGRSAPTTSRAEFDRMIAHVQAETLRDAADFLDEDRGGNSTGYKLRNRARRIEEEAGPVSIRREDRREAERQADRRFPDLILAPENEQRAVDFADGFEAGVLWRDEQADREPSDAEVRAALREWYQGMFGGGWTGKEEERMRAALLSAQESSERHDSTENGSVVPPSDAEVEAAARVLLRDYESQYAAEGIGVEDFADLARDALLAAQDVRGRGQSVGLGPPVPPPAALARTPQGEAPWGDVAVSLWQAVAHRRDEHARSARCRADSRMARGGT